MFDDQDEPGSRKFLDYAARNGCSYLVVMNALSLSLFICIPLLAKIYDGYLYNDFDAFRIVNFGIIISAVFSSAILFRRFEFLTIASALVSFVAILAIYASFFKAEQAIRIITGGTILYCLVIALILAYESIANFVRRRK